MEPTLISVTPDNLNTETVFCIKNPKHPGFQKKKAWFTDRYEEGMRLLIAKDAAGKPASFIEFVPGEYAWRPVQAKDYFFIHCLFTYPTKNTGLGYASTLLLAAESAAKSAGKAGLAVFASEGAWLADPAVFLKNGFQSVAKKDRFELLVKKLDSETADPEFYDWTTQQAIYNPGWHIVYADQCPMHDKSAEDLYAYAAEQGLEIQITKLSSAGEAQLAPSGFGVYSLLKDGKLLEDHYISKGRFINILKKQG